MQDNMTTPPLPENFKTLTEFWEFWDNTSSADYEDMMDDVTFEVATNSHKNYCAISTDLLSQIRTLARQQGVSTETLVNVWLQEKLSIVLAPKLNSAVNSVA